MKPSASFVACDTHPGARAGWRCNGCGRALCPACAGAEQIQHTRVVRCLHCGKACEELMVAAEIPGIASALPGFLGKWLSLGGLALLIGLGLVMVCVLFVLMLFGRLPGLGYAILFLYVGIFASFFFGVLRDASVGRIGVPRLGEMEGAPGLAASALRFVIATVFTWLPLIVYLKLRVPLWLLQPGGVLNDPIFMLLLGVGYLYMPGALITAGASDSIWVALNPLYVFGLVFRAPARYFGTLIMWIIIWVATFFWWKLLVVVIFRTTSYWFLKLVLVHGLGLLPPLASGFVLGWFIYRNEDKLREGRPVAEKVPALPGAVPRGNYDPAAFGQQPQQPVVSRPQAIELPLEDEAPEGDLVPTEPGASPASALTAALEAGDDAAALDAYRRLTVTGQKPLLEPRAELRLAGILDRVGMALDAARACRRAAERNLKGPLAPKAIFTAARLLVERAGNPQQGRTLYEYLIANYPNDDFSQRAADALRRLPK